MSVPVPFVNPINPGDITALRISLTNSNPTSTVTGVAFTDNLPAQLTVAGAGAFAYTCVDGSGGAFAAQGTVTAVVGSNTISLAGGVIPIALGGGASGHCDIDVQVTSVAAGTVQTNTIAAGTVSGVDTGAVANGTPAVQSITVNNMSAPTIGKSFSSPSVVKTDQTVRLSILITNTSATVNLPLNTGADTPAFAMRDVLPAGLQVAAAPNPSSVCSGIGVAPAFTPAAAATTLIAVGGTVEAGGTCTLQVDLVGTSTGGNSSQVVANTINRSTDFADKRGLTPPANATANLTINSQISVSQVFNPSTVSAGQTANKVITISNGSPLNSETITTFTDDPIDGVGNAGFGLKVGVPTTTCAGGAVAATAGNTGFKLTGGTIAANSFCTVTVPYVGTLQFAGVPQAFTNTIPQGAIGLTDATVISNFSQSSVTVVDQLTVSKSANPPTVSPGNPIRYTITVNNFTVGALTNVRITDALPNGLIALPALPAPPTLSGAGCVTLTHDIPALPATNSTPHFTIGTFPAGVGATPGTCTVTFWAMPPAGIAVGTAINNAIGPGGVANNNGGGAITNAGGSGNASSTVTSDITVAKIFNPANASEGTVSQLTVTFTNFSAQTLTNASFTDNFPLGTPTNLQLVVANPAVASTTCGGVPVITSTPGAASVAMTGAIIPARAANGTGAAGSCVLKVNVIGPAGTYSNSLPTGAFTGTQTFADTTTAAANSPGPIIATITYNSALTTSKAFSPATIAAGGKSTVTVRLGNTGTGTLNNVSVTDPLPANLLVATPPNAFTTCGGAPVITAAAGTGTVSMTGAVIPANIQCNLLFDVTGSGAVSWVNTIPIGGVTATGGVQNVSPVTATLTNNTTGSVSVTNNTAPNNLTAPGQISVLTVTLTNGGAVALSSLNLTNYFTVDGTPGGALSGMVVGSTPAASTTCPGGVVSAITGGTSVALTGATLAAAPASCTITVNVTLITTGTVQDIIPIGAISTSQGITNTLATVTSLSAGANLGVTKSFFPAVVQPGVRSQLQLTFINPINLPVSNLSVVDNLPGGVTVPAAPNASTTCAGGTVAAPTASQITLTGGSLPAASGGAATTCTLFIDVVAAAAGIYTNTVAIGGVTGTIGGSGANNPVPASATLGVFNPVTISKAFATPTVAPGTPDAVTITLNNPNTTALTGAVLMDSLPVNLTVALVPNASTTCGGVVTATASATSVTLTGGTIPASGACNIKFDTVSNVAGTYVNTIAGGNLATNQGVTNANPATDTVKVLDPPTVGKQFTPASIPAGGISQLTIVLGNTNASAATLTALLTDTLPTSPANIVVATPNGLSTTCPGAVTAVAASGTVTYANGALIPAGGCVINVNVTGATTGTYVNAFAAGDLKTTLGNSVQPASANLVISPLGFITGRVWKDNNVVPNGVFDVGTDTPIAGVTINLTGTDYGLNNVAGGGDDFAVNQTTTTDALGNYQFVGLHAGSYTVTEPTQPASTLNGITTAGPVAGGGGGSAGTATGTAVTPSAVSNIILLGAASVANSTGNNFAEVAPSSISGTAFLDQNNDGIQGGGDTPLVGVTMQLLNGASVVIATTTTDASGNYSFSGLPPGTYSVQEPAQPVNTANGKTIAGAVVNGGAAGTPTAQNVVPSVIANIVLPPNTITSGNNFAEVPAGRQVLGRVFIDFNKDGIFNGTDIGVSGYTLSLTGIDFNGIAVNQSVATAADGSYVFGGLAAGTYNVNEPSQPPATTNGITTAGSTGGAATGVLVLPSSITGINLTGTNTISTGNNFAEIDAPAPLGSLAGYVYIDSNNNGVIDAGEVGIAGVVINLTGTDNTGKPVNLTTTSFANNGAYFFVNLPPSNAAGYTLTEIQPAAFGDGKTTVSAGAPGAPVSAKPVAGGGGDVITGVVIGSTIVEYYNFGERPPSASISGTVYVDANNNGMQDAGEAGIAGVTVTLTGTDKNGKAVSLTQQTGPDGSYVFTGLAPSDLNGYTLNETQPAAYADGKDALGTLGGVLGNDHVTGIIVTGATSNGTGYNFGELPAASLTQSKTALDVNGGALVPGDIVEYTITTTNTGQFAAANVSVFDGADPANPFPPRIQGTTATTYVANSTTSNGVPVPDTGGGSPVAGATGLNVGTLAPGASNVVKLRIQIPAAAPGGTLVNGASFNVPATGGTPVITGTSTVTVKVIVSTASVSGHVWLDANHNRILDPGEALQPGWTVELLLNGMVIRSTQTDVNGFYQFTGLTPGSGYQIRFRDPTSGVIFGRPVTNEQGNGANPAGANTSDGTLNGMTLSAGENVVQQSLPLDPSGVVYNAVTRVPVQGATVTITGPGGFNSATQLVGGGLMAQTGATSASQVTGTDGYYEFVFINLGLPGGPPAGTYTLTVTPPAGQGFVVTQPSTLIPPTAAVFTVPGPSSGIDPIQPQSGAPPVGATTTYYLGLSFGPNSAGVVNNHIPLDPVQVGAITVTKTTPLVNVSRGDLVPYTLTARNATATALTGVTMHDRLPPGFRYRTGSARLNNLPQEPVVTGRDLAWNGLNFASGETKTFKLVLMVGSGVGDGEYTNIDWAANTTTGTTISNVATAVVRVIPDGTLDCSDIIGKVFDDKNANGYQDEGEPGLPNIRISTARGLLVTSDAEGRFHVACADIPQLDRGSNFVMKLDERTLPSGYRVTTENPRDVRVTRGKMTKLNFGAAAHRVFRVELTDAAFVTGEVALLPQWKKDIAALPARMAERPSVLRLAYTAGNEDAGLVKKRVGAIADEVRQLWRKNEDKDANGKDKKRQPLIVEIETVAQK